MCLNAKRITKTGCYKETTYKGKQGDSYDIDTWGKCGSCEECMAEKANNWVVRNYYEERAHKNKCFITLTYAENPRILIKKDLQDFLKRLRFKLDKNDIKIRYFGNGEYGTLKYRPHFHLIIYGWKDERPKYKDINKKGNIIYDSEIINKAWGKGITSYQNFDSAEIPYIALYNSPNDLGRKKMYAKKEDLINKYKNSKMAQEKLIKKLDKIKSEYAEVKEFNVWSTAIGFNEWLKDYEITKLTFEEYIGDGVYMTPSPWIKAMANWGEIYAIEEMKKRTLFEIDREETEEIRQLEKDAKAESNHSKDIIKWQQDKETTIL